MHLFAKPAFGADARAIADDQHPDEQFRINRRSADCAVERGKLPADIGQVDKAVDGSEQMICRHMLLKAEAVKQLFLHHRPFAHHQQNLPFIGEN
jgi:hypothetical protein